MSAHDLNVDWQGVTRVLPLKPTGQASTRDTGDQLATPLIRWARSGLMALSGAPNAAPALPPFDVMGGIDALLNLLRAESRLIGGTLNLDSGLLTERAALMQFTRQGTTSCNRSCRLVRAKDGWIAVNLPREVDLELIAPWLGKDSSADPWNDVTETAATRRVADLVASARMLGMAVSAVPSRRATSATSRPWRLHALGKSRPGSRDWQRDPPLVIDLSALWAAPLCGSVLARLGARVIKVESVRRPDTIRESCPKFFDSLNATKESVVLDFTNPADRGRLASLIARCDVVLTSARPRAFEQLGLQPEKLVRDNPSLTWVAVTAQGWSGPRSNCIGFGDDVAAGAGLLTWDDLTWGNTGSPMFLGDAVADPLTGIAAAAGALVSLRDGGGWLVDANLHRAACFVASARRLSTRGCEVFQRAGQWHVRGETFTVPVSSPTAGAGTAYAAAFGADTERVLAEFT